MVDQILTVPGGGSLVVGTTPVVGGNPGDGLGIGIGNVLSNSPFRHLILANTTFYVDPAGSDSNPGTIGSPFQTVSYALIVAASFDWNGFACTIQLGTSSGAFSFPSESWTLPPMLNHNTTTLPQIIGNIVTPANIAISMLGNAIVASGPSVIWQLSGGWTITVDGAAPIGFWLNINNKASITYSNIHNIVVVTGVSNVLMRVFNATLINDVVGTGQFVFSGTPAASSWGPFFQTTDSYIGFLNMTFNSVFPAHTFSTFLSALSSDISNGWTITNPSNVGITNGGTRIRGNTYIKANALSDFTVSGPVVLSPAAMFSDAATGTIGTGVAYPLVSVPVAGGTVAMGTWQTDALLTPAAGLATLTLTLPPIAGLLNIPNIFAARVYSSQAIVALTVNTSDGSTIVYAPGALAANQTFSWIFSAADNKWYPSSW